jgi:hypothetical protein
MAEGRKLYAVTLLVEVPDHVAPPDQWVWDNMINTADQPAHKHTPVLHASSYEVRPNTRATDEELRH